MILLDKSRAFQTQLLLESSEIPLESDDEPGRTKPRRFMTVTISSNYAGNFLQGDSAS
jgi:hypothetical protein